MNVFEFPGYEINRITKSIEEGCADLDEALSKSMELHTFSKKHPVEFGVMRRLENIVSHESVHAGGVIIQNDLSSYLPIKTKSEDRNKRIVVWDKYMLEEIGHNKFDILGLKTLPVIQRTLQTLKEAGIDIDLDNIDFEDQAVYDMLCKGDVSGVFQLAEQAGKVVEQQPRNFRDIIAINALIRPGTGDWHEYIARRRGKEWYKDPLRPWMHETYGTMTYQEQFLWDAYVLAGWPVAYGDKHIRKGKNLRENVELRDKFIRDMVETSHVTREYAESVWEEILGATGDYSFNKSHAATYGRLSFKTAWLKCHYPEYFYASLMTTEGDDQDAIAGYVAECKIRGIAILPPDINVSGADFVPTKEGIRFRITTIRHVGDSAIDAIEKLRPIASFDDFMERREKSSIKANVVDSLIKAGCFDFDNPDRGELLWRVEMLNRTKTQIKEGFEPPRIETNDAIKAEWEKQSIGMYLSVHPMEKYGFEPFSKFSEGDAIFQGGQVLEVNVRPDKKGNNMAFVTLDTLYGTIRILVFSSIWSRKAVQELFEVDKYILVRGKKSGDSILFDSGEFL